MCFLGDPSAPQRKSNIDPGNEEHGQMTLYIENILIVCQRGSLVKDSNIAANISRIIGSDSNARIEW